MNDGVCKDLKSFLSACGMHDLHFSDLNNSVDIIIPSFEKILWQLQ